MGIKGQKVEKRNAEGGEIQFKENCVFGVFKIDFF